MSELLVNTIKKADGTGSLSVPAESGTVVTTASPSLGRRNLIINGAMVHDQRNGGSSVTLSGTEVYTVDRWRAIDGTDGGVTIQQSSDAPSGFNNSLLATITSADSSLGATQYAVVRQSIEGFNTANLALGTSDAKSFTVSFYVKSSVTGTFGGAIQNAGFNRSYPFTYTINSANTWEQKSVTISGDTSGTWATNNTTGLQLLFSLGAGATYSGTANVWTGSYLQQATGNTNLVETNGATWQITGVQLEVGSVATPFEHRSYGEELALCQRYYWQNTTSAGYYAYQYNSAYRMLPIFYPVVMRDTPTATITYSGGSFTTFNIDNYQFKAYVAASYTSTSSYNTSSVKFEAEL